MAETVKPADESDPVVGHKTFIDGRHEPVRRSEAEAIWTEVEAAKSRRAAAMPDSEDALRHAGQALLRLRDFGWHDGIYCPKDGTQFAIVMWGSTGVHSGHYIGEWPNGHVYCGDFLLRPEAMLWKATDRLSEAERAAMERSIEDDKQFMERQMRMFSSEEPARDA